MNTNKIINRLLESYFLSEQNNELEILDEDYDLLNEYDFYDVIDEDGFSREEVSDYELDEKLELLHDDDDEDEDEDEEDIQEGVNIMKFSPQVREAFKRMVDSFVKRGMSRDYAEKVALKRIQGHALI